MMVMSGFPAKAVFHGKCSFPRRLVDLLGSVMSIANVWPGYVPVTRTLHVIGHF